MLSYIKIAIAGAIIVILLGFGVYWHISQNEIARLNQTVAGLQSAVQTDNATITKLTTNMKLQQTLVTKGSKETDNVLSNLANNTNKIHTEVPLQTNADYVNSMVYHTLICSEIDTGATAKDTNLSLTDYSNWVKQCAN